VKERHDLNCDGVEMLWIEVLIPNFKLLVRVVYRPPGTTESSWDNFDYSFEHSNSAPILVGSFITLFKSYSVMISFNL
jgi:hypothetical protein